jgi:hypothetical protein
MEVPATPDAGIERDSESQQLSGEEDMDIEVPETQPTHIHTPEASASTHTQEDQEMAGTVGPTFFSTNDEEEL